MNASQVAKMLSQCPICKKSYLEDAVKHVGQDRGAELYHCSCKGCGHAMMAVVLEQAGLVSSIGMLTDLEVSDALQLSKTNPITKDECVKIHRVLEKESQALCQALLVK